METITNTANVGVADKIRKLTDQWAADSGEFSSMCPTDVMELDKRLIAFVEPLYEAAKLALTTPGMIRGRDQLVAALALVDGVKEEKR